MSEKYNGISKNDWEKEIDNAEIRTLLGNVWYGYDENGKKIETENGKKMIKVAKDFLNENQDLDPLLFRILIYNIKYYFKTYIVQDPGNININSLKTDLEILKSDIITSTKKDLDSLKQYKVKERASYIANYLSFLIDYYNNTTSSGRFFTFSNGAENDINSGDIERLRKSLNQVNALLKSQKNFSEGEVIQLLQKTLGARLFKKILFGKFIVSQDKFKPELKKLVEKEIIKHKDNLGNVVENKLKSLKSNVDIITIEEEKRRKKIIEDGIGSSIWRGGLTKYDYKHVPAISSKSVNDEDNYDLQVPTQKDQIKLSEKLKDDIMKERIAEIEDYFEKNSKKTQSNIEKANKERQVEIKRLKEELVTKTKKAEIDRQNIMKSRSEDWARIKQQDAIRKIEMDKKREKLQKQYTQKADTNYLQNKKQEELKREQERKDAEIWRQKQELEAKKRAEIRKRILKARDENEEFDEIFEQLEQERLWGEREIKRKRENILSLMGNPIDGDNLNKELRKYLDDLEKRSLKYAKKQEKKLPNDSKQVLGRKGTTVNVVIKTEEGKQKESSKEINKNETIIEAFTRVLSNFPIDQLSVEINNFVEVITDLLYRNDDLMVKSHENNIPKGVEKNQKLKLNTKKLEQTGIINDSDLFEPITIFEPNPILRDLNKPNTKAPTTAPTMPQQTPNTKAPTTAPTMPQQTPNTKAPTKAPTMPQQTPSAKAPTTAPTMPQQTPSAKAPTTAPTIPQQTPSAKAPTTAPTIPQQT
nr:hypothetical protein [Candidatus Gracilibacteria bacterium]